MFFLLTIVVVKPKAILRNKTIDDVLLYIFNYDERNCLFYRLKFLQCCLNQTNKNQ